MKRLLVILVLQVLAFAVEAHQDRLLSLSPNGAIPELPLAYAATRVGIAFSESGKGKLTKLTFTSSGHETVVPTCLLEIVRSSGSSMVSLAGSWYHDERHLPHYVYVKFNEPGEPTLPEKPGTVFLFSLRDARLLEVEHVEAVPNERAVKHLKINLTNGCPR